MRRPGSGATAEIVRAVRTRTALAVALLDIDRFKVINDTYGHLVGDQVLKEIARTLRTMLREYDLAGRFGGEEFALLLPQTRAVDAFRIAERIRSAIAGPPSSPRARPAASGCTSRCRSGSPHWTRQQARVRRADGGRGRRAVPGQELRPGPGADDQHDQGPERGQQHPAGRRRGPRRRACSAGRRAPRPRRHAKRPAARVRLPGMGLPRRGLPGRHGQHRQDRGAPCRHRDAFPVLSTSGVEYPWQVQPLTVTGAPPPLPRTWPVLILAA